MKKVFVFISVSIAASIFAVGVYAQGNEPFATHRFGSFVASTINDVEVNTSNGTITLDGNDGSIAIVEVFVTRANNWGSSFGGLFRRNRAQNDDIQQLYKENYAVVIKVENGKLYAVATPSRWNLPNDERLNISFKITVPRQVNSNLRTSNGSVKISNLQGSHNFNTSNASLNVENVSGKIRGTTSNGRVTLTNVSDDIDVRTSNGGLTARDCNGKLVLKTSNSSANLNNVIGEVSVTTSNGSVTVNGLSGSLNAKSSNGSMTVTMACVNNDVILNTSNGGVSLTLPANNGYNLNLSAQRVNTSNLKSFQGSMSNNRVEGTVSNGGPNISVRTTNGNANLTLN